MAKRSERFSSEGAAALHVAVNAGVSPLEILEMHPVSGKVSARWLIVLYLLRQNALSADEISEMLNIHPRTIMKMLHNLDRLRKADPKVMELIQQMLAPSSVE